MDGKTVAADGQNATLIQTGSVDLPRKPPVPTGIDPLIWSYRFSCRLDGKDSEGKADGWVVADCGPAVLTLLGEHHDLTETDIVRALATAGFFGAMAIAIPFAVLFGWMYGKLLNKVKGEEKPIQWAARATRNGPLISDVTSERGRALALGTLNATSVVQHTGAKVGILARFPTEREINRVKIKKVRF
jgi:hypothetical protein